NIGLGRGRFYADRVGDFPRVQADGEHLPFADESFDLTYCVATLHHALDLQRMANELARVTRRGGVVAAVNEGTRALGRSAEAPGWLLGRVRLHEETVTGVYADLLRYRELFASLFRRDLNAKYKGSALGLAWSLANPLALMGIYFLVFAVLWRVADLDHYALY